MWHNYLKKGIGGRGSGGGETKQRKIIFFLKKKLKMGEKRGSKINWMANKTKEKEKERKPKSKANVAYNRLARSDIKGARKGRRRRRRQRRHGPQASAGRALSEGVDGCSRGCAHDGSRGSELLAVILFLAKRGGEGEKKGEERNKFGWENCPKKKKKTTINRRETRLFL